MSSSESEVAVARYLVEHSTDYSDALDHFGYGRDERSRVNELRVVRIELTETTVHVHYEVKLSAYHGCQDVDLSETEMRRITGRRIGRVFFFERYALPARRTTVEEF